MSEATTQTLFHVHLYRVMCLSYGGIAADSPESAAAIARERPSEDADSLDDCDGESLAALVDTAGDELHERSVLIDLTAGQEPPSTTELSRALRSLLDATGELDAAIEDTTGAFDAERRLLRIAYRQAEAALAGASGAASPSTGSLYSVLLAYPHDDPGEPIETFYTFVRAPDACQAVQLARREACAANAGMSYHSCEFEPLLCLEGHHPSLPQSS